LSIICHKETWKSNSSRFATQSSSFAALPKEINCLLQEAELLQCMQMIFLLAILPSVIAFIHFWWDIFQWKAAAAAEAAAEAARKKAWKGKVELRNIFENYAPLHLILLQKSSINLTPSAAAAASTSASSASANSIWILIN